jgi:hypothetical protein
VSKQAPSEEAFDPGATICGHGDRSVRAHYLGGGLWVCFECLTKLLLGGRYTPPKVSDRPLPKRRTSKKP